LVNRTSGVGTRGKSSLSSCSLSNLRGVGPKKGLHELVRDPGAHLPDIPVGSKSPELETKEVVEANLDPSVENQFNYGVFLEDVGHEDEPILVESRTDPSNI